MINKLKFMPYAMAFLLVFSGCDEKKDEKGELTVKLSGLTSLGGNYVYEGWLIVDKKPVAAGRFDVDNKTFSKTFSDIDKATLDKATAYVLTIEPKQNDDPAPSSTHILAGSFSDKTASLSIGDSKALNTDFSDAGGTYILATPTDEQNPSGTSGVWWLIKPSGSPSPSLTLPTLPAGWKYEGWAVANIPLSTGKFTSVTGKDESAAYSGSKVTPFPGEDFLSNAPDGVTFPLDLRGKKVVISVEPDPDNDPAPFLLKPLIGDVPADAKADADQKMSNIAKDSNPEGSATRS